MTEMGAKLQAVWREILDAEQARGQARGTAGEAQAQAAYEQALVRFRHMQIEAFTVTLGSLPLVWEALEAHAARIGALERAVGEGPRDEERP